MKSAYILFFLMVTFFIAPRYVFATCDPRTQPGVWQCYPVGPVFTCATKDNTDIPSGECSNGGESAQFNQCSYGTDLNCTGANSWNCWKVTCTCMQGRCPVEPTVTLIPSPTVRPTATITPRPPTATMVPSPTPLLRTKVSFTVFLHGLGNSGDNANPASSLSNKNPLRKNRSVSVEVLDSANRRVGSAESRVLYASDSGSFSGEADLGTSLPAGNYFLTVKSDQYLRNTFSGFYLLTPGQTTPLTPATLTSGDVVTDNKLDILDYNIIYGCYTGTIITTARSCTAAQKTMADLNDEGVVNLYDYNLFIRELSVQTGR